MLNNAFGGYQPTHETVLPSKHDNQNNKFTKQDTAAETAIQPADLCERGEEEETKETGSEEVEIPRSRLLELPLEIRLQIYSHLVPLHEAKHAHLSSSRSYPPETSSAYFLRCITQITGPPTLLEEHGRTVPEELPRAVLSGLSPSVSNTPTASTISYNRRGQGCGHVPSALMRSCRQIYEESRMLSWEVNEFVFVNWFASGVYAARAFLRGIKPWQREAMRFARVEVLQRDLEDSWVTVMTGGSAGGGEWVDLCALWSGGEFGDGLRGLRLGIKGRIAHTITNSRAIDGEHGLPAGGVAPHGEFDNRSSIEQVTKKIVAPKHHNLLDAESEWVNSGLKRMKNLRWLELEIEDDRISRDVKVQFCLELGASLSSAAGRKVDVVYVEKVIEEKEEKVEEEEDRSDYHSNYVWGEIRV